MLKAVSYVLVPVLSVLVTFLTGSFGSYSQGVPLPWRNVIACPGPGMEIACFVVDFSWIAFVLDALLYVSVGYGLLLGWMWLSRQTHSPV